MWGRRVRGRNVVGVEVSGVQIFGVEVSVGSKCRRGPCVRGPSVFGVEMSVGSKCLWGPNVPGVEMSVGSKCQRGQSVFGVEMGVNRAFNVPEVQLWSLTNSNEIVFQFSCLHTTQIVFPASFQLNAKPEISILKGLYSVCKES